MPHRPPGITLIELLVALTLFGLLGTLGALALGGLRGRAPSPLVVGLSRARASAIRAGVPVAVRFSGDTVVRFLPDGRAIGPAADPLTGRPALPDSNAHARGSR